ncbi:MAG: DNA primase [Lachnospirales bacterium]
MIYPQDVIEDLRSQIDIVDIIGQHVKLKRSGNNFFGLCPFHNEKSPSFSVSQDRQFYHCFGCGASGNVFTFIMEYERMDFPESIEFLSSTINFQLPTSTEFDIEKQNQKEALYKIHKVVARHYFDSLHSDAGSEAMAYLLNRKLSPNVIKKFGIGFASFNSHHTYNLLTNEGFKEEDLIASGIIIKGKNGNFFDRFYGRIMFPILNTQNKVIGFGGRVFKESTKPEAKYLNSPETPIFSKSYNLYGLNFAKKTKEKNLILVEGYMDVISLFNHGIDNAIASLGTAFNDNHIRNLRKFTNEVILLFDSDDAGKKAALRAIPFFKNSGIRTYIGNLGDYKDPDEFLLKNSKDDFIQTMSTSKPYIKFLIDIEIEKHNMEDINHRVECTQALASILKDIDNSIEREEYIKLAAKISEIPIDVIRENVAPKKDATVNYHSVSRAENITNENKALLKSYKTILHIMLLHKNTALALKDLLLEKDFQDEVYRKLLRIIVEAHVHNKTLKESEVISYFPELKEQRIVSEIFNTSINFNISDLEKIVNDLYKNIKNHSLTIRSNNVENIVELQEIIKEKKALNKLNITINNK